MTWSCRSRARTSGLAASARYAKLLMLNFLLVVQGDRSYCRPCSDQRRELPIGAAHQSAEHFTILSTKDSLRGDRSPCISLLCEATMETNLVLYPRQHCALVPPRCCLCLPTTEWCDSVKAQTILQLSLPPFRTLSGLCVPSFRSSSPLCRPCRHS